MRPLSPLGVPTVERSIADDMMLANGIEQAVEDAGAEVVELDEADYRKLFMVDNCHKG